MGGITFADSDRIEVKLEPEPSHYEKPDIWYIKHEVGSQVEAFGTIRKAQPQSQISDLRSTRFQKTIFRCGFSTLLAFSPTEFFTRGSFQPRSPKYQGHLS